MGQSKLCRGQPCPAKQTREDLAQIAAQLMEAKVILAELQARDDGSGAGAKGEPYASDKVIRFKSST